MPSADFCDAIRTPRGIPSPDSGTRRRPPEVSPTAFSAQPPNLPPAPLMDMGFAVISPLARRRRPRIRFLSIGSRLCYTLPSDHASRRRPCASLDLHLHQVGQRTFTSKLSNMLGTLKKGPMGVMGPGKRGVGGMRLTMENRCLRGRDASFSEPRHPSVEEITMADIRAPGFFHSQLILGYSVGSV